MNWRLIESGPADGYRNMAIDEALLESCASGAEGFPCLRIYSFRPICLSLGFSQRFEESVDLSHCRSEGIDVVRRPTGGRAVLHAEEITYSVVGRQIGGSFGTSVIDLYRSVSRGLLAGFHYLGIEAEMTENACSESSPRSGALCFAEPSRHEISQGSAKIAGSALARRRGSFLQHGSIPLHFEMNQVAEAAGRGRNEIGKGKGNGLSQVLGREVTLEEAGRALRRGFESGCDAHLVKSDLSVAESLAAERFRSQKYLSTEWSFRC